MPWCCRAFHHQMQLEGSAVSSFGKSGPLAVLGDAFWSSVCFTSQSSPKTLPELLQLYNRYILLGLCQDNSKTTRKAITSHLIESPRHLRVLEVCRFGLTDPWEIRGSLKSCIGLIDCSSSWHVSKYTVLKVVTHALAGFFDFHPQAFSQHEFDISLHLVRVQVERISFSVESNDLRSFLCNLRRFRHESTLSHP